LEHQFRYDPPLLKPFPSFLSEIGQKIEMAVALIAARRLQNFCIGQNHLCGKAFRLICMLIALRCLQRCHAFSKNPEPFAID
jgi:hypothetical protein